jgi:hypothetical protein
MTDAERAMTSVGTSKEPSITIDELTLGGASPMSFPSYTAALDAEESAAAAMARLVASHAASRRAR